MKKLKAIQWDPSQGVIESAGIVLPPLASHLFRSGRSTAEGKLTEKRLHGFRLEVKRFRYTLELFRPLYGPALDKRLSGLRRLQQLLGRISDCAAVRALLLEERGKKDSTLEWVLRKLDAVEQERTGKFLNYWKETFDAPGEEQAWVRYLRNYAGRGKSGFRAARAVRQPRSGKSYSPRSSG